MEDSAGGGGLSRTHARARTHAHTRARKVTRTRLLFMPPPPHGRGKYPRISWGFCVSHKRDCATQGYILANLSQEVTPLLAHLC